MSLAIKLVNGNLLLHLEGYHEAASIFTCTSNVKLQLQSQDFPLLFTPKVHTELNRRGGPSAWKTLSLRGMLMLSC